MGSAPTRMPSGAAHRDQACRRRAVRFGSAPKRDSGLKGGIRLDAVSRDSPGLFYDLRKALRDTVSIEKLLPESSIQNGSDIFRKLMLI